MILHDGMQTENHTQGKIVSPRGPTTFGDYVEFKPAKCSSKLI
jgi:hypothetical protein